MVKAITENTRPWGATTAPATPLTSAGGHLRAERRHRSAARRGIEHFQEGIEVATARSGQERIDDPSLSRDVALGLRRVAQPAAGSAGELLGCRFGAVERGGDVGEWHAEHVVQHKCESLSRSERVEHSRVAPNQRTRPAAPRVRSPLPQRQPLDRGRALKAPPAGRAASAACSDTPDDGRSHARMFSTVPGSSSRTAARPPAGIFGFAYRPEHPVGDRPEMRALLLETLGQPLALTNGQLSAPPIGWLTCGGGRRGRRSGPPPPAARRTRLPRPGRRGLVGGRSRRR